jgi:hypothetical protein
LTVHLPNTDAVRIKENSLLARLAAYKLKTKQCAIVINRTIHLHNTNRVDFIANRKWLLHELKHVEQYQRYGTIRFIILYLYETMRNGYRNNRFEVEAREAELISTNP